MKKPIVLIAIIMSLCAAGPVFGATGRVTADILNVRSSPEVAHGNLVTKIYENNSVTILETRGDWLKIKTSSGATGWVVAEFIKQDQPPAKKETGQVVADRLNLRSSPDLNDGNIVTLLTEGTSVTILETREDWLKVQTSSGSTGWVFAAYIDRAADNTPDGMLRRAQKLFAASSKIRESIELHGVEKYRVYDSNLVMQAYDLSDKALHMPGIARPDMALLLRGKCLTVIGWYGYQFDRNFFIEHKSEFEYNTTQDNYVYRGGDFKTLLEKYPDSNLVDDAAFEHSNLPKGGACNDILECKFKNALYGFKPFFKNYPDSNFVLQAIEIINAVSVDALLAEGDLSDGTAGSYTFNRDAVLNLLIEYREAVSPIKSENKLAALYPIAAAFAAMDRPDKARPLLEDIVKYYPNYEHLENVKKTLLSIKSAK